MEIILSNIDQQPIYQQICRQIREQILTGQLPPEAPLPSIRNLARDLRISVITTKRAYEELERGGYIVTVAGKGSFVARADTELLRQEHLHQLHRHLRQAAELAPLCALEDKTVLELLAQYLQEDTL